MQTSLGTNRPLFAALLVLAGCGRVGGPPGAGTETSAPAPQPKPGDSSNAEYVSADLECKTGPTPAPPSKSPIATRRVQFEDMGRGTPPRPALTTIRRVAGPAEGGAVALDGPTRDRIAGLARGAWARAGALEAESPVPDGMGCDLRLFHGARLVTVHVAVPTRHEALKPLVEDLVKLLPAGP